MKNYNKAATKICTVVDYEDLPPKEQEFASNNGNGKEWAGYLKVQFPGHKAEYYSDAMEPEDVCFYRDLSWIGGVIEEAYQKGTEAPLEAITTKLAELEGEDVCSCGGFGKRVNHLLETDDDYDYKSYWTSCQPDKNLPESYIDFKTNNPPCKKCIAIERANLKRAQANLRKIGVV